MAQNLLTQNFYNILTNIGKAKMANAYALGTKVNLTTLAAGDSLGAYYEPTEDQVALKNQVWSGNINSIDVDASNSNWIVISAVVPTTVGGFTIREVGLFDDSGNMLAVGKYPETYKPQLAEGSSKDLTINMILEISNISTVTLKVDPTVVLATKKDIQSLQSQISSINIPTKASDIGAEPTISTKNTAFNQNFETSSNNIKMDGTASVGASNNAARSDHVHPSDTSKANQADFNGQLKRRQLGVRI